MAANESITVLDLLFNLHGRIYRVLQNPLLLELDYY